MRKIAVFRKVSEEQFIGDCSNAFGNDNILDIRKKYKEINLPKRSTRFSAGHDICTPFDVKLCPGEKLMIPTGIRCEMSEEYVMLIFPRSSLGIKKGMTISNTVPVVDADYFFADNEGHIFISIKNNGNEVLELRSGEKIVQAVFVPFGVADEEEITTERTGGIGSTGK